MNRAARRWLLLVAAGLQFEGWDSRRMHWIGGENFRSLPTWARERCDRAEKHDAYWVRP